MSDESLRKQVKVGIVGEESLPKHVQVDIAGGREFAKARASRHCWQKFSTKRDKVCIVGRSVQQSGTRLVSLGEVFNKSDQVGNVRWV